VSDQFPDLSFTEAILERRHCGSLAVEDAHQQFRIVALLLPGTAGEVWYAFRACPPLPFAICAMTALTESAVQIGSLGAAGSLLSPCRQETHPDSGLKDRRDLDDKRSNSEIAGGILTAQDELKNKSQQ
jgi:hypothetical protein